MLRSPECLEGYLNNKIMENKCVDIKCPDPKCATLIQYYEISDLVAEDMMQKFETFSVQQALAADPNARWCPKPGCGNCVLIEPGLRKVQCNACRHEFCGDCREDVRAPIPLVVAWLQSHKKFRNPHHVLTSALFPGAPRHL